MITYQGIMNNNKIYYLCFSNDDGIKISVPIDEATGNRISLYLNGFDKRTPMVVVERSDEEAIEE